jgi:hypothetical protein
VPTLKASQLGLAKIKQARNEQGWGWSIDEDDTCFVEASRVLEPDKPWGSGGPYASGISQGTWRRFLAGKQPINAPAFKAYCTVLGLDWEAVVDRRSATAVPTRQDWGEAPALSRFYGRTTELMQLEQWVVGDRCCLVSLSGMGGIGKTSLAVKLAETIQDRFEFLIWRSLRHAPPLSALVSDVLEVLAEGAPVEQPATADELISQLLDRLRAQRCLLVLDDFETVLRGEALAGQYCEGYEDYGELVRRAGVERHQSCLFLISREQPLAVSALAGATLPVQTLRLRGLGREDARQILAERGLSPEKRGVEELILLYRGNPSALKIIATTIQEIFNGNIAHFLDQSTLVIGDVFSSILNEQFARLSVVERGVLYWLAIENQPISWSELRENLRFLATSSSKLVGALESLKRRSLLDREHDEQASEVMFAIQPLLSKYVTNQLIEQICQDILAIVEAPSIRQLGLLRSHALVTTPEDDDLTESQMRPIVSQTLDRLYLRAPNATQIPTQLEAMLALLEGIPPQAVGYAQTNLRYLLETLENR